MEHSPVCKVCDHLMADHGKIEENGREFGYCANGNDGDCNCTVKGLSYEEALEDIRDE